LSYIVVVHRDHRTGQTLAHGGDDRGCARGDLRRELREESGELPFRVIELTVMHLPKPQ
jgi:hypothetical protein